MSIASFVQSVSMAVAEERKKALEKLVPSEGVTWRLKGGVTLVPNMEVRCPGCKQWFPTGRIWLVDEDDFAVIQTWSLKGDRMRMSQCHPHVGSGGSICTGDDENVSAIQALTTSISPMSWYSSPHEYFKRLGDDCDFTRSQFCNGCGELKLSSEMREVGSGRIRCADCGGVTSDENESDEDDAPYVCVNCDNEVDAFGDYCPDCCCESCVNSGSDENEEEE